jgi:Ala-tRNA(Pro) deacylase
LGVSPGSVTPLALINDTGKGVQPVLDSWMMDQELINVHPLANTATVTLRTTDLARFVALLGRRPVLVLL